MITKFISGKYYRLAKEGYDIVEWNEAGAMNFLKDEKLHLCKEGYEIQASFFDSPEPNRLWVFSNALEYFYETLPKVTNWKEEMKGY